MFGNSRDLIEVLIAAYLMDVKSEKLHTNLKEDTNPSDYAQLV